MGGPFACHSGMISGAGGSGTPAPAARGLLPLLRLTAALLPAWLCTPQATLSACSLQPGSGQETARRLAAQGPWAEERAELWVLEQEADLALELVTVEVTAEVTAEATVGATGEVRAEATGEATAEAVATLGF